MLAALAIVAMTASAQSKSWSGTWTATAGTRAFSGTWQALEGETADTVTGGWSLNDPSGTPLMAGTWSARKDAKTWQGAWQARAASGQVFSGTWRAQGLPKPSAPFAELFEAAASKAIQGTWQMGTAGGNWSIRAYSR
jgi:hypothetical protein